MELNTNNGHWLSGQTPSPMPHRSIIQQRSGICGGNACIPETRIPVWTIIAFCKLGAGAGEILKNYPELTAEDLQVAVSYYETLLINNNYKPPMKKQETLTGLLLITPALTLLILVFAYPILRAFGLSLFTQNLGTELEPIFSGFTNYQRLLVDGRFWQTMSNTTIFTVFSITLELLLGMMIALVLNQSFRGRGLVRTVALIPWALPTAVMGLAWAWIFNDQFGVVNDILIRWHFIDTRITWLGDPMRAMVAMIFADVWKTTPFIAIILLAGLQSIPSDLYEAHAIDGATPVQSFREITLPLLMPQIVIALLFRFAQAFGTFDLVQVMTGGGPAGATETVSIYIYATVRRYLDFGYGAALVVVTFLLLIAAVLLSAFLLRKRSN